ncbi:PREDICTED: uncharacterized protein LOC107338671 [Acropora digitifera]|uniref:uncharacterized protein LOC107338671 n=1 Tax=Acropora digitifera TaxID=70779 RepID=UPI00077A9728|nr:PREDICTED: uncharacterized protein LOC107338671 [Acropora digitifera]
MTLILMTRLRMVRLTCPLNLVECWCYSVFFLLCTIQEAHSCRSVDLHLRDNIRVKLYTFIAFLLNLVCSDQFNNNWSVVHLSSDNEDLGNDALSELEGGQEELRLNGYVTEDLSTPGVTSGDEFVSRLSEMLSCLEMLGNESQVITLSFLPHSFEEFIWQGTEDNTVMVAVLLKPSSSSANQDRCQKMITHKITENVWRQKKGK